MRVRANNASGGSGGMAKLPISIVKSTTSGNTYSTMAQIDTTNINSITLKMNSSSYTPSYQVGTTTIDLANDQEATIDTSGESILYLFTKNNGTSAWVTLTITVIDCK